MSLVWSFEEGGGVIVLLRLEHLANFLHPILHTFYNMKIKQQHLFLTNKLDSVKLNELQ